MRNLFLNFLFRFGAIEMLECVEWFMVNLAILDELLEAAMVVIV